MWGADVGRPRDEEYYEDRTVHVAQGDIFRDVPFFYAVPEDLPSNQAGTRQPLEQPPSHTGYGMLLSYTSGFMAQPPGTRGYAHAFRLVAPIFPLDLLNQAGVLTEASMQQLPRDDHLGFYMYLPPYPQEFEESVVCPYRPVLVHHDLLEGRRVTQLQESAAVQLQMKLATNFLGGKWRREDLHPDLSDHWG